MHLRHRIQKNKLDYNEDGTPVRKYSNQDPPGDRDTYKKLQINDPYKGYKDIVYTPIDMPYLDINLDLINSFWKDPAFHKANQDVTYGCKFGAGLVLFLVKNKFTQPEANSPWFDWVEKEIPHVKEFIEQLPFKSIRQCSFVQPPKATVPHYDEPINMLPYLQAGAPSQYRIRWSNVTTPEDEVFFLTKDSSATKVYPMLPPETNTFVYDGSVWEHGADQGFKNTDRMQIIISGVVDNEKHHALLDKSIEKYNDYVIYNNEF